MCLVWYVKLSFVFGLSVYELLLLFLWFMLVVVIVIVLFVIGMYVDVIGVLMDRLLYRLL